MYLTDAIPASRGEEFLRPLGERVVQKAITARPTPRRIPRHDRLSAALAKVIDYG
jgi:hypothetical protein